MATVFYDRDGNGISTDRWLELKLRGLEYVRIGWDEVPPFILSTVWLGTDEGLGKPGDPPMIFETLVFDFAYPGARVHGSPRWLHSNETAARDMHAALTARLRKFVSENPPPA